MLLSYVRVVPQYADTEYVSAQFHLKHDDFFETVREVNAMPQSKWQELAKFTPEEMTGKPLLLSAAKDYKRQVISRTNRKK
jgi:hypothetical protein